jgi:hypothetical protein
LDEVLTSQRTGKGTTFRETRRMGRRTASTELTVSEFEPNHRIRLDSVVCGARWSTLFTLESAGSSVGLNICTATIPQNFAARLLLPLMLGMVRKALDSDLDAIKRYCEQSGTTMS